MLFLLSSEKKRGKRLWLEEFRNDFFTSHFKEFYNKDGIYILFIIFI